MELMVTVAIIGILAAIAIPSYRQHVIRGNRAAAQAEMMAIDSLEQQYSRIVWHLDKLNYNKFFLFFFR